MSREIRRDAELAYEIVSDAGGEIIGRTKIQKIAYFLEALNLGAGFQFCYKHYGPFSEELSSALKYARIFELVSEEERPTAWGGFYSIFKAVGPERKPASELRGKAVRLGNEADPVELELAATALFLASEGNPDPWRETERRKPEKTSSGRLKRAKALYEQFRALDEDGRLPAIA